MPILRSASIIDSAIKTWQGKYKALADEAGSHAKLLLPRFLISPIDQVYICKYYTLTEDVKNRADLNLVLV